MSIACSSENVFQPSLVISHFFRILSNFKRKLISVHCFLMSYIFYKLQNAKKGLDFAQWKLFLNGNTNTLIESYISPVTVTLVKL